MSDCPFCLPRTDVDVLAKSEHCYIAATNDPVLRTSVMIIPVRHVETPFDLTPVEWMATHAMLLQAREILGAEAPDGFSVGWNVGAVAGQEVFHAHLHVIGRYADEPMAGRGIRYALKQPGNARRVDRDRSP